MRGARNTERRDSSFRRACAAAAVAVAVAAAAVLAVPAIPPAAAAADAAGDAAGHSVPPPPLLQVAGGTDARDIECKGTLVLMIRPSGDPACVTARTAERLEPRGWSQAPQDGGGSAPAGAAESAASSSSSASSPLPRMPGASASGAYSPGPYAVGVVPNFVRDHTRPFDAWGAEYKSAEYAGLLARIAEAGDPSTTATNIYYPSPPGGSRVERPHDDGSGGMAVYPAPLWAPESGERQTSLDMFMGSAALAASMGGPHLENRTFGYQSYRNAPPAAAGGPYPLVLMVHGLGGGLFTWSQAAEYMASHGYVVAALAYSSDSNDTPVFEDPSSAFAAAAGPDGTAAAYALRSSETGSRLFANFMKFLYGYDGPAPAPGAMPDPASLTALPGGGIKAGRMMGDLFEQRTEDLAAVLSEMRALNLPEDECLAELAPGGGAKEACGPLAGMIDADRAGAMGHSLGSMTVQSALAFVPGVDAAVGFNNGMPKRWEPYGGMPDGGNGGLPDGVPKPLMIVTGSDDAFVHMVFRDIHLKWFEDAGGDVSETYPLAIERAWPTADNRQPVARAAYERAQAAKVLVEFADEGHSEAVDDIYALDAPGSAATGLRVPLEPGAAQEEYAKLGWVVDDGGIAYLPHQMRNYFATAWFDWQLKGDEAARMRVADHPFGDGVRSMLHEGVDADGGGEEVGAGPAGGAADGPCREGYALVGDVCAPAPDGYVEERSECEMAVDSREAAGAVQDYQAEIERCREQGR